MSSAEEANMQINTHADVDVIAIEEEDQVTIMVDLVAPEVEDADTRPPAAVQVVLDRSGSMGGGRLEAAKAALLRLIDRLDPSDAFGLVTFDHEVDVPVPAGPVTDKHAIAHAIQSIQAGGSTNLSSGLLRGVQEARRVAAAGGATLLLLSDGHANDGEVDPARLAGVASAARKHNITTTTVGIGEHYDELLLSEVARGGQGNHVFAEQSDDAAAAVAGEIEGLLSKTVQAASLIIRPEAPVESVTIWNDVPSVPIDGGIMIELGDLWSGEERRLVLTFSVPAMSALGVAQIAELEVRHVAVPALNEQTMTLPVCVNVVPGDQAAGRIPDPKVRTELIFQQAQGTKRRAADALRDGSVDAARSMYCEARDVLASASIAYDMPELAEEAAVMSDLDTRLDAGDDAWVGKFSRADMSRKSRQRGRE